MSIELSLGQWVGGSWYVLSKCLKSYLRVIHWQLPKRPGQALSQDTTFIYILVV